MLILSAKINKNVQPTVRTSQEFEHHPPAPPLEAPGAWAGAGSVQRAIQQPAIISRQESLASTRSTRSSAPPVRGTTMMIVAVAASSS